LFKIQNKKGRKKERKTLNVTENKLQFSVIPLFSENYYLKQWYFLVRSLKIEGYMLTSWAG
jgi:hypothetical protein